LGTKENNISYSVGYSFSTCPVFLSMFLKELGFAIRFQPDKIKIRLQRFEKAKGFTDFEIIQENEFHIIIEAKRGWEFPGEKQLSKYVSRELFNKSTAKKKMIVLFNESNEAFAKTHFKMTEIGTVPIVVLSWSKLHALAQKAIPESSHREKFILRELNVYLQKISTMQKLDSNWVYIVSLGPGGIGNIGWRDFVEIHKKYFHPVGGSLRGWPAEPPNYMAFRYGGKLQSIHHIDSYSVITNLKFDFGFNHEFNENHYLYSLGPAMKPLHEVKSGLKIVRSMRVWAMLDLLLTSSTIQEARDLSHKRELLQQEN